MRILGLRWQEETALRPQDLELDRPVARLKVVGTLERSNGRVEYKRKGKTDAARRTLKMPERMRLALAWQIENYTNEQWVFAAAKGGFLRYDNFLKRVWKPATKDAGIASDDKSFDFHEFRHTAAAFMIADGADPLQVMRRMGLLGHPHDLQPLRPPLPGQGGRPRRGTQPAMGASGSGP